MVIFEHVLLLTRRFWALSRAVFEAVATQESVIFIGAIDSEWPDSPEYAIKSMGWCVATASNRALENRQKIIIFTNNFRYNFDSYFAKIAHISITFLPSDILFWHIRAIQGLNSPNMPKYTYTW